MTTNRESVTRREFLGKAGAGAATLGMAAAGVGESEAARASAAGKRVGANDKIVLGLIGCGGMGAVDMGKLMENPAIQVAALCDVDTARMPHEINAVEKKYGKRPALFGDYRKMLERKDIDAIIIGSPDHWHCLNLIHTVEAGKDAYCEKPISHDIAEAKTMDAAVKRFKKIVQVGTWQRSTSEFQSAIEYVRSGKAGKIVLCRAWSTDTRLAGHPKSTTPPATLNYDMWNGPATWIPYADNHVHYNWRWFTNYGTGKTGDWGVHMMDMALLAMSKDTDLPMPTQVTCYGGKFGYPDDGREFPDTVQSIMRFKDPDWIMHWQTGRDFPGRPEQGVEFVSAEGKTVRAWRGGWEILDKDGTMLPKDRTPHTNDHWENWVDCLKSREQPRSHLASMAQTTIVCHLCNAAYESGETVEWSKEKMEVVGKAGRSASAYAREYRRPWKLPVYRV